MHARRDPCDALSREADRFAEIWSRGLAVISTIHGAKGREARDVLLVRFRHRDEEDKRVEYVACTRARKRLVVVDAEDFHAPVEGPPARWDITCRDCATGPNRASVTIPRRKSTCSSFHLSLAVFLAPRGCAAGRPGGIQAAPTQQWAQPLSIGDLAYQANGQAALLCTGVVGAPRCLANVTNVPITAYVSYGAFA